MYLKIDCAERIIVIPAQDCGPVVAALQNAKAVSQTGFGKDTKFQFSTTPLEISFVPDTAFDEATPPLEKALANYEQAQKDWLDEYAKRTKFEAKVKELEETLKTLRDAAAAAT